MTAGHPVTFNILKGKCCALNQIFDTQKKKQKRQKKNYDTVSVGNIFEKIRSERNLYRNFLREVLSEMDRSIDKIRSGSYQMMK